MRDRNHLIPDSKVRWNRKRAGAEREERERAFNALHTTDKNDKMKTKKRNETMQRKKKKKKKWKKKEQNTHTLGYKVWILLAHFS